MQKLILLLLLLTTTNVSAVPDERNLFLQRMAKVSAQYINVRINININEFSIRCRELDQDGQVIDKNLQLGRYHIDHLKQFITEHELKVAILMIEIMNFNNLHYNALRTEQMGRLASIMIFVENQWQYLIYVKQHIDNKSH